MVAALAGRGWRPFAGPFAFLLVATIAVGVLRGHVRGHAAAAPSPPAVRSHPHAKAARRPARKLYVVRAGDTIGAIAVRNDTTTEHVMKLNPSVSPTALFIGEKLRLR